MSWRFDLELYLGLVQDSGWWIGVSRGRNLLQMWIPFTGYVAVATSGITVTWRSYRIPSYPVLYVVGICWFLVDFERCRLFLGAARRIPVEGMHCLHPASF